MTTVLRIPLTTANLDQAIANTCDVQKAAGYRLAGCFSVGDQLVLIFQKP